MNTHSIEKSAGDQSEKILYPHKMTNWLDPATVRSLSVDDVLARVNALKPLIAANARETELLRHPVDKVWSAIRDTGVFYLFVPKKYGGMEAGGLQALTDAVSAIGEACTSTAHCACFSIYHQWMMMQFPETFQKEIWSEFPYFTSAGAGIPSGIATRVEGGFRLSGRWKWGSGIMHADWINTAALVEEEDGKKQPYFFFLPIEDGTILDTWFVDGQCGTGSHDYTIKDAFVPEHRVVKISTLMNGQSHHENPFYRLPMAPAFALTLLAPALGAARGAVNRYRERLMTPGPDGKQMEKSIPLVTLARAEMQVSTAELIARDANRELENLGGRDTLMSLEDRVRVRTRYSYAMELCLAAVRAMSDEGGSSAHFLSNPAQRALRDITMLSTHAIVDKSLAMELFGRICVGLPSNSDWFR